MRTPWGTLPERQLKLSKHIRTPGGGLTETYVIIAGRAVGGAADVLPYIFEVMGLDKTLS